MDHPMLTEQAAFVGALVRDHDQTIPVLANHLDDNSGVLYPYLFFSDLTRWMRRHAEASPSVVRPVLDTLERRYVEARSDVVPELIRQGVLDNIGLLRRTDAPIRRLLPPTLAHVEETVVNPPTDGSVPEEWITRSVEISEGQLRKYREDDARIDAYLARPPDPAFEVLAAQVAALGAMFDATPPLLPVLQAHLETREDEWHPDELMRQVLSVLAQGSLDPATTDTLLLEIDDAVRAGPEPVSTMVREAASVVPRRKDDGAPSDSVWLFGA